jgi:hypothetical protein
MDTVKLHRLRSPMRTLLYSYTLKINKRWADYYFGVHCKLDVWWLIYDPVKVMFSLCLIIKNHVLKTCRGVEV